MRVAQINGEPPVFAGFLKQGRSNIGNQVFVGININDLSFNRIVVFGDRAERNTAGRKGRFGRSQSFDGLSFGKMNSRFGKNIAGGKREIARIGRNNNFHDSIGLVVEKKGENAVIGRDKILLFGKYGSMRVVLEASELMPII